MIREIEGNIFSSRATALVNPVNCMGISGKGLALEFKLRFPQNFGCYQSWCHNFGMEPGDVIPHTASSGSPYIILNVATKDRWWDQSTYDIVEMGIRNLRFLTSMWKIPSVAVPALGCGCGGLDWKPVRRLIELNLDREGLEIEIYPPQ